MSPAHVNRMSGIRKSVHQFGKETEDIEKVRDRRKEKGKGEKGKGKGEMEMERRKEKLEGSKGE